MPIGMKASRQDQRDVRSGLVDAGEQNEARRADDNADDSRRPRAMLRRDPPAPQTLAIVTSPMKGRKARPVAAGE